MDETPCVFKKEEAEPVKQEEPSIKKEEEDAAGPSGSVKAEDAEDVKEEASVSIDPEDLLKASPRLHATVHTMLPMFAVMPNRPSHTFLQEFFSDVRDVDRDNEVNRCACLPGHALPSSPAEYNIDWPLRAAGSCGPSN